MKMDIEFGEWSTLTDSDMATLKKFRQIAIEFHWLEREENHKTSLYRCNASIASCRLQGGTRPRQLLAIKLQSRGGDLGCITGHVAQMS